MNNDIKSLDNGDFVVMYNEYINEEITDSRNDQ